MTEVPGEGSEGFSCPAYWLQEGFEGLKSYLIDL